MLAGEANAPGTYSKRTVNFISSLDKQDAILFSELCQFTVSLGTDTPPFVYEVDDKIYAEAGITFSALTHLDSIGLVRFEALTGFAVTRLPKRIRLNYHGTMIGIEFPKDNDNKLDLGHVMLTQVGRQLARICGSRPNAEFMEYVVRNWIEKQGVVAVCPYPRPPASD